MKPSQQELEQDQKVIDFVNSKNSEARANGFPHYFASIREYCEHQQVKITKPEPVVLDDFKLTQKQVIDDAIKFINLTPSFKILYAASAESYTLQHGQKNMGYFNILINSDINFVNVNPRGTWLRTCTINMNWKKDELVNPIHFWHELGHALDHALNDLETLKMDQWELYPLTFEKLCERHYNKKLIDHSKDYAIAIVDSIFSQDLLDKPLNLHELWFVMRNASREAGVSLDIQDLDALINDDYFGVYYQYLI